MSGRWHRLRTRIGVAVSPFTIGLGTAGPAAADTAGGITAAAGVAWLQVADSDNVPVNAYALSLDGGSPLNPMPGVEAFSARSLYGVFKAIIDLALWLLDNVLSFSWLRVISEPLNQVGTQMTHFALSPAVIGLFGTIAAGIIGVAVLRGFMSQAAAQIGTALVLAMMAVTLGGRQVAELVGPTGLLAMGRDIGFELSTLFSPGGPRSGAQAVSASTAALADHFARTPTQLWNFGRSLDQLSPACGRAWSEAIASGYIDTVKDAVRQACPGGDALHHYAMNNAANDTSTGYWSILFAAVVLIVFGYLAYHVVILGMSALFWSIVAVFAAVVGFIPGPAQSLAVKALLDAVFSWIGMMGYVVAVCVTGSLTSMIFTAANNQVAALPLTAMLLCALAGAVYKIKKKLAKMREDTADKAVRIGAKPGHTVPGDLAALVSEVARPAYRPGTQLGRLDPLTAVPAAGQHARRITKTGISKVKTAAVTAANPAAGAAVSAATKGVAVTGAVAKGVAAKPQPGSSEVSGGRRGTPRTRPGGPTTALTRPPTPTSPRRTRAAAAPAPTAAIGAPAQQLAGQATADGAARRASRTAAPRATSPTPARKQSPGTTNAAAQLTTTSTPTTPAAAPAAATARRARPAGSAAAPQPPHTTPAQQRPAGSIHPALREAMRAAAEPPPPGDQP